MLPTNIDKIFPLPPIDVTIVLHRRTWLGRQLQAWGMLKPLKVHIYCNRVQVKLSSTVKGLVKHVEFKTHNGIDKFF